MRKKVQQKAPRSEHFLAHREQTAPGKGGFESAAIFFLNAIYVPFSCVLLAIVSDCLRLTEMEGSLVTRFEGEKNEQS